MKKLLQKTSILFFLVVSSLFIINYFYVQTNSYQNKLIDEETYGFNKVSENLKVVNLGSSHGMCSFVYQGNNVDKHFNFGLSSQSLVYDLNIIQNYAAKLLPKTIVFIPISYFSLYGEVEHKDFELINKKYYKFLSTEKIINYDKKIFYLNKIDELLPITTVRSLSIAKALLTKVKIKEINEYRLKMATEINDIDKHGRKRYEGHIIGFDIANPTINKMQGVALENMLELCQKNNWRPVFVTTPLLELYSKHYSAEFLAQFESDVQYFARKYQVPYLDYSKDNRFKNNLELFIDADHLNLQGGKLFTSIVMEDIKKLGIEPQI